MTIQMNLPMSEEQLLPSESQNVEVVPLLYIVSEYNDGSIEKPEHQREIVWSELQKEQWIKRLKSDIQPVGVIVTYQIKGSPKRIFLNDGWQRLSTTAAYLSNPERFGDSLSDARILLKSRKIPVQHRVYSSQDEALQDFQYLNMGTSLTCYEFYRGILTYMPGYKIHWENFFKELHEFILPIGRSILASKSINLLENADRKIRHKGYRDDYALFLRFMSKENGNLDYERVGQATPSLKEMQDQTVIEWQLRNALQDISPTEALDLLRALKKKTAHETKHIGNVVPEILEKNATITITLYRWLLHVSIWKTFHNIQTPEWDKFLRKILYYSGGGTTLVHPDDPRQKTVIASGKVSDLTRICLYIGSQMYTGKKIRKNGSKPYPGEGIDRSHKVPFSSHGDGETFLEPSGLNRSRGAKPVEDDDLEYDYIDQEEVNFDD